MLSENSKYSLIKLMNNSYLYHIFPSFSSPFGMDYLIANDCGEFQFLTSKEYNDFREQKLVIGSNTFENLKSKFFLTDTAIEDAKFMTKIKFRTKKQNIYSEVSLHMVVTTIRCNCQCIYCQVNSKNNSSAPALDMDISTAKKTVDMIFKSPSDYIK